MRDRFCGGSGLAVAAEDAPIGVLRFWLEPALCEPLEPLGGGAPMGLCSPRDEEDGAHAAWPVVYQPGGFGPRWSFFLSSSDFKRS